LRPCENSYKDQKGSIGNSLEVQKVGKTPENPHVLDWTQ